ncbi:type II toxin-antitoxin system VapC family toxin [Rubrivirga sp.]|uniref:type II toxin-antitoxin system VapC family toxin n=1 Tax=Rubrivirga sp. TaxID=1885344 RepID=UPI003B525796
MRVLFDTNVVLDLLLEREPYARDAALLTDAVVRGVLDGYVSAHAVTTVFYVVRKARASEGAQRPADDAYAAVRLLTSVFRVASVSEAEVLRAVEGRLRDFEDAVTAESAKGCGSDVLVTRDVSGFEGSEVEALAPRALLSRLAER